MLPAFTWPPDFTLATILWYCSKTHLLVDSRRGRMRCWYTRIRQEQHLLRRLSNSNLLRWWRNILHCDKHYYICNVFVYSSYRYLKVFTMVVILWICHYFLFRSYWRYGAVHCINPSTFHYLNCKRSISNSIVHFNQFFFILAFLIVIIV